MASAAADRRRAGLQVLRHVAVVAFAVLFSAACPVATRAQVAESGNQGGLKLSAGGTASAYAVQYGQRKLLGFTAFVDAGTTRRFGLVAETTQMLWHQTDNVHLATYSAGARYHFDFGRFQPYAKGLVGEGEFNFPYNYATGHYFVVTGGGGLDYRLTRRIWVRAADFEYQDWPQFTYGAMTNFGVSAGVRVQFFGMR
ncbi:MAG: outer membrane beta-barrel protein [Terracidiphilus sp.]